MPSNYEYSLRLIKLQIIFTELKNSPVFHANISLYFYKGCNFSKYVPQWCFDKDDNNRNKLINNIFFFFTFLEISRFWRKTGRYDRLRSVETRWQRVLRNQRENMRFYRQSPKWCLQNVKLEFCSFPSSTGNRLISEIINWATNVYGKF